MPGGFRWVYVYIDKFSKWIEYKPLVQAIAKKTVKLLDDITHRFGLSDSIITDLGPHSPVLISGTSTTKCASQLSMSQSRTPGLMAKSSTPTA